VDLAIRDARSPISICSSKESFERTQSHMIADKRHPDRSTYRGSWQIASVECNNRCFRPLQEAERCHASEQFDYEKDEEMVRKRFVGWITLVFPCVMSCVAVAPLCAGWRTSVVTDERKDEPTYYNSQRLAMDRRGNAQAVYITQTELTDHLMFARNVGGQWQAEEIFSMPHAKHVSAGIKGLALEMDAKSRPHIYIYTSDYPDAKGVFGERWLTRTSRRWENRVIRHSVGQMGGAAMHDPHLAVDGRGYIHVTAYVHAGFGTPHRARHRYFDGRSYQIDALPRPPGKTDSSPSNLCIGPRNSVHFVYDSKKAYNRGNAEAGYPDSSIVYVVWNNGRWSPMEIVKQRVSGDPEDTGYFVMSTGIALDSRGIPHVAYAISKRRKGEATTVYYAHRSSGKWQEEIIFRLPPQDNANFRCAVFNPVLDRRGRPHIAFDTPSESMYVRFTGSNWAASKVDGDLEGFTLDAGGRAHLLTSQGSTLTHHVHTED